MTRDLDLICRILLYVESRSLDEADDPIELAGCEPSTVGFHLKLLVDAGFTELSDCCVTSHNFHGDRFPTGITWEGYEFLDACRDEEIWKRTTRTIAEKVGSASLAVILSLATSLACQKLGIPN